MKKTFSLLISIVLLVSFVKAGNTPPTIIKGHLKGLGSGKVYLTYNVNNVEITDSVSALAGAFTFQTSQPGAIDYYLSKTPRGWSGLTFFASAGTTIITGHVDSIGDARASGTRVQLEHLNYKKTIAPYQARFEVLVTEMGKVNKVKPLDVKKLDSLGMEYDKNEKFKEKLILDFVTKNPNSVIGPWAIIWSFHEPDAKVLGPYYDKLSPEVRASSYGKAFKEMVDIARITSVGEVAPEFSQADTSGKVIALSSLRGQYVLIDFWASWCKSCRAENPYVLKAYNAYKAKGFTVIGVSADMKRERWVKAIKEDNMPWVQVSDLKGFDNGVIKQYGITAIPLNLLLDKEGRIIAKNLKGDEYQQTLAKVLK